MRIKPIIIGLFIILMSTSGILVLTGFAKPDSELGTGLLGAYKDPERTTEVPTNGGAYKVLPSETYYFTITGITEFRDTNIIVLAIYSDGGTDYAVRVADLSVGPQPSDVVFEWTIPGLPQMTSINFVYGPKADLNLDGKVTIVDAAATSSHWSGPPAGPGGYDINYDINDDGQINVLDAAAVSAHWSGPPAGSRGHCWCDAKNELSPSPRLLLVVPEVFLGPIGALVALFSGVGIRKYIRRKKD